MDVEKLMAETEDHHQREKQELFQVIQQLKKRCVRLQNENRGLRKSNDQLVREKKKRQHYKNGKRGTKFNG